MTHKVKAIGSVYEYYLNDVLKLTWNAYGQRNVAGSVGLGGSSQYRWQGGLDSLLLATDTPLPQAAGKKNVPGVAVISGGGNIYIWSEDHYGAPVVSGGGAITLSGAKGANASFYLPALHFPGNAGDYLRVTPKDVDHRYPISYEYWAKFGAWRQNSDVWVLGNWLWSTSLKLGVHKFGAAYIWQVLNYWMTSDHYAQLGHWYHVCMVYPAPNRVQFFIDGGLNWDYTFPGSQSEWDDGELVIGAATSAYVNPMIGDIGPVRVYPLALSSVQVAALFNGGRGVKDPSAIATPAVSFPLTEGQGNIVRAIGTSHQATVPATVTWTVGPLEGGCSGGGAAVAQATKGAQVMAAASGGGAVALTVRKDGAVALTLSGGGSLYASVREEAYRVFSLSGGGVVTAEVRKGAKSSAMTLIRADFATGIDEGFSASVTGAGTVSVSDGYARILTSIAADNAIVRRDIPLASNKVWDITVRHRHPVGGGGPGTIRGLGIYQMQSPPEASTTGIDALRVYASQNPISAGILTNYRTPSDTTMGWDYPSATWKTTAITLYAASHDTWYSSRLVSNETEWYFQVLDENGSLIFQTTPVPWSAVKEVAGNPYWLVVGDASTPNTYGTEDYDYIELLGPGAIPGLSGGGAISLTGMKGGQAQPAVAGAGEVAATGDAVAGTFVWALIRGGGEITAFATKYARAPPLFSGGGRLTVRAERSWPYIDLTPPADTDSTALLVLLELDWCGRTFGVAPCLASGTPCYNTWRTCKYISAYQNVGRTYRFCSAEFPQVLPDARPYVASVRWMPTEIKTNLTVNARVTVEMADEPDGDVGIDPYWSQRSNHPGTFWKKLLARNANYRGRTLKIFEGRPGAPESTYTLRWIGKLDNITVKGAKVALESVDLLKDLSKVEVPPKVNTKLAADVAVDYTLGLSLTEDVEAFPSLGYVRIDDEIIRYESKDDVTKQLSTLSRAQFGTAAAEHKAKTKVQPVRYFTPKSGFDHLLDMLLVDAGIDPGYVDEDAFTYWKAWPQRDIDFSAVVSEPKKLSDLFFEVVDLLDCKVWVAENLKITIRRNVQNAPGRTYHVLSDEDDITLESGSVDHNEKSRITRVSIYWDKIATGKDGESTSYRRLDIAVDPDAESNYDGVIEKTVLCRWIDPTCGEEGGIARFVQNLGLRRITRQRDAQPLISVELPPKDAQVLTGDYVRLSTDEVLGPDGSPITRRIFQVVKRDRKKEMYALTLLQVAQRRVCLIAQSGLPDYSSATEGAKEYGFITGADGKMSDGTDGYYIW